MGVDAHEQMQIEHKQFNPAEHRRQWARIVRAPAQYLQGPTVGLLFSRQSLRADVGGGLFCEWRSHASQSRAALLTVPLEDPGDRFVHILLQFCGVEAEAALEGDQTNSLC